MFIKAAPDRLVRDPATRRPVDDTPLLIDETDPYWARMLIDQDVVETDAPVVALVPVPAPVDGLTPAPPTAPAPATPARSAPAKEA